jgi:hypothetical protein
MVRCGQKAVGYLQPTRGLHDVRRPQGQSLIARLLLLALALALCGCSSPAGKRPTSEPVSVRIPDPHSDHVVRARVALPRERQWGPTITVTVGGEILRPGSVNLPGGSTLLEAISRCGGFTDFAYSKKIVLVRQSRELRLYRFSKFGLSRRYDIVWYSEPVPEDHRRTQAHPTDFILEDGDQILVPRCGT